MLPERARRVRRAPARGAPRAANGWAREGPHRNMSEHGSRNGRPGRGSRDGTLKRVGKKPNGAYPPRGGHGEYAPRVSPLARVS